MEFARSVDNAVKDYVRKRVDQRLSWDNPALEGQRRAIEALLTQPEDPFAGNVDSESEYAREWTNSAIRTLEATGHRIPEPWCRWIGPRPGKESDFALFYRKLRSTDVRELRAAVHEIAEAAIELPEDRYVEVAEALASLFYIDKYDRPDLQTAVDDALVAISDLGEPVVPFLVERMCESDINATLCCAQVLGRIGGPAIDAIMVAFETAEDPHVRATALYALSKVRDRHVERVFDKVLAALEDRDFQVRVAAARAFGKFAEMLPGLFVPRSIHEKVFIQLIKSLSDEHFGVRSKVVRTIGKMAKFSYISDELRCRAKRGLLTILGRDENAKGDPAFVVRQEAEESIAYL